MSDSDSQLKDHALEVSKLLATIAKDFPADEAAAVICANAAGELRQCYGLTRDQELARVLRFIGDGHLSIADLCIATWWQPQKIKSLLQVLVDRGYLVESKEQPRGGIGRPRRVFRMTTATFGQPVRKSD